MIEGLRKNGIIVTECHQPLWQGIEDRINIVQGGWRRPKFWWRVFRSYLQVIIQHSQIRDYDILMVGYPGQLDVFIGRILSKLRRRPLVWDVFMSIYLIASERGMVERKVNGVKILKFLEKIALRLPDMLIIDTADYALWMEVTYGIRADRFSLIPTGADDRVFRRGDSPTPKEKPFRVLYHGTFIPNHGVETIIEAANVLKELEGLEFEFIGNGPDRSKAMKQARDYHIKNIHFIEWLDKEALVQRIRRADVCLGAFGSTPQSVMTVQNKIYEGLAMAKPVITGDSMAVRRSLIPGEAVWVCRRADPMALSEAILRLYSDPALRNKLMEGGYKAFIENYDLVHIGQALIKAMETKLRLSW